MRTRSEILAVIANGENSFVAFKRDDVQRHELAKDLVALANLEGGRVLLGVAEDGMVCGISRTNIRDWILSVCQDKIRPAIEPYVEYVTDLQLEKDIVIVRVTRGYAIHSLWHRNSNRFLLRWGKRSREIGQQELTHLMQQRGSLRQELMPVSGTGVESLDLCRLRNYFESIREQYAPEDTDTHAWRSLLESTQIMSDEAVTVSGMLLFGRTPHRYLPLAGIEAVAYRGSEHGAQLLNRASIQGPMTPFLDSNDTLLEGGLVEQTLDFVRRNTSRSVQLADWGRKDCALYPEEVVREAIVNALIHRDYSLWNTNIQVAIYDDRLEIVSPGRLPNGITPERMRVGTRAARNEVLKDVMRDYRYLEHMGMGVPRKIVKGMFDHKGTDPELIEKNERFTVRLFA